MIVVKITASLWSPFSYCFCRLNCSITQHLLAALSLQFVTSSSFFYMKLIKKLSDFRYWNLGTLVRTFPDWNCPENKNSSASTRKLGVLIKKGLTEYRLFVDRELMTKWSLSAISSLSPFIPGSKIVISRDHENWCEEKNRFAQSIVRHRSFRKTNFALNGVNNYKKLHWKYSLLS